MWIRFDVDEHGCGQGSLALMLPLFSGDTSSPQCRENGDRVPKCEWNERGSKEDQSNALDTVQREEGVEKTEEKNGRCQNTSLSQSGVPSAHRTARGSFSSERSTATRVRLAFNCEQETAVTHRNFLFPYFSYKVTPRE